MVVNINVVGVDRMQLVALLYLHIFDFVGLSHILEAQDNLMWKLVIR